MPYIKEKNGYYEYSKWKPFNMDGFEQVGHDDPRIEKALSHEPISLDSYKEEVRAERDLRLSESDKYVLSDYPLGSVSIDDVNSYRQALRDLPDTITDVGQDVVWPQNPVE